MNNRRMTETVCDVLVVGAGPAGASAARQAAQAGASVLCVDRRHRVGEPVQCAEFVPLPMLPYTRGRGVLQQAIRGMHTLLPSGQGHQSPFPGLMIDRGAFDRALAARAVEAGAALWTGAHFQSWDGTCAGIWRDGTLHRIRSRLLIGADGPHSDAARLLGAPPQPCVQTRQYTVPLAKDYPDTDIFLADDYPGGYGWLFPKGRVANLGVGADRALARDLRAPLAALHQSMLDRGIVRSEILARTGGAIPVGGLRKLVWRNAVLVGDAAGLTHPITGAGIAAAVLSGECAGNATADWLGGRTNALADYAEEMHEQFGPSLARALSRRAALKSIWHTPRAREDSVMRSGWIAFDDYFKAPLAAVDA